MWPILGRYGPFFLYSYTVVLSLGVLLALMVTLSLARRHKMDGWLDGWLLAGIAAIAVGRLAFVMLNETYFAENPAETWQVWRGGLNVHGVLLSGLLVYWLWARVTGRPFGQYAGLIAPGLALLAAAGWAACWFEGCAYGTEATPAWSTADLPDDFGVYASRYQTQLAGILVSLVIFAAAWWTARRNRLPVIFWSTLGLLALSHAGIALFRGDPAPVIGGLRLDLVLDLVVAVAGAVVFLWLWIKHKVAKP